MLRTAGCFGCIKIHRQKEQTRPKQHLGNLNSAERRLWGRVEEVWNSQMFNRCLSAADGPSDVSSRPRGGEAAIKAVVLKSVPITTRMVVAGETLPRRSDDRRWSKRAWDASPNLCSDYDCWTALIETEEKKDGGGGKKDARRVWGRRERERDGSGKMSRKMKRGIKKGEKKTVKVRKRGSEGKKWGKRESEGGRSRTRA